MKTARKYVVDHHQPGHLPDRSEPSPLYTSEEEAIEAFKAEVKEPLAEAHAEALANEASTEDLIRVKEELDALTISLLLTLKVGEEIAATVAGQRYYLMLSEESPVKATPVEDPIKPDVKAVDTARVDKILDEIDNLPPDAEGKYLIDRISREVKAGMIADLLGYFHEHWRVPQTELSNIQRAERNGMIHAMLTAAGVPYAVAGETRPSREWQNAHEAMSMIALDKGLDPMDTAYWLVDLPKGEAAPPSQPDFAEQIRDGGKEAEIKDILGQIEPNPWFAKES